MMHKLLPGEHVYVFNQWITNPVFHGYGRDEHIEDEFTDLHRNYTECGRMISEYNSVNHRLTDRCNVYLPLRHALKFARPCKRCFG